MADTLVPSSPTGAIERVLIGGDLSKLSADDRMTYYMRVCESAGLNPLTQPFDYITLNGKLVLYAKKNCTDQLRTIHDISVVTLDKDVSEGILTVTAKVQNARGRTDADMGSVHIAHLKGDALANAIMKAATKAKRRATLSICGLGLLDETEIETIPAAALTETANTSGEIIAPPRERVLNPETGRMVDPNSSHQLRKNGAWDSFLDKVQHYRDSRDGDGLRQWYTSDDVASRIAKWPETWREQAEAEFSAAMDWIEAQ